MITWVAIGLFVTLALALNLFWRKREQGRTETGRQELDELRSMGDVIPASIHPYIDPIRCIGSGACVYACPEKSVLTVVNGRGVLTNPLGCIGHGACASACPVQAITLVFGTAKRGLELPNVDPDFQTNQPGVYIVGELGGMGLIRNAVSQGRQAADHIVAGNRRAAGDSLDASGRRCRSSRYERNASTHGSRIASAAARARSIRRHDYPLPASEGRHDGLPGLPDLRARFQEKDEQGTARRALAGHQEKTGLQVAIGELVEKIERGQDGDWRVSSTGGVFETANVLLALGRRGSPRKLEVPGEEHPKSPTA